MISTPAASWYKDAVLYEVPVRAFMDANGDGVGDFDGLITRLDYIAELGVTAIWLLPFYPSPGRDDGYDIADYDTVNPAYGTLGDVRRLVREAHKRGLRVVTELVCNHTSDQHPWFQRARRARKGTVARDFYVWSDTTDRYRDARIIFKDFERSNWTWDEVAQQYYWHRFYAHQPDLNYENPRVEQEILKVVDHWLGMGIDGLRLDAIPYLYEREGTNCENLPESHQFLKRLRAHVDRKFPGRMLLAEANQWPDDAAMQSSVRGLFARISRLVPAEKDEEAAAPAAAPAQDAAAPAVEQPIVPAAVRPGYLQEIHLSDEEPAPASTQARDTVTPQDPPAAAGAPAIPR